MANEKELNPSPTEVEGEFKQIDVDARLGQEWGTLSPNPDLQEKLEKGEHGIGTPTNPNFNDKLEPEPIKTKNEVIRLIQEYGSGGTKLYQHTIVLAGGPPIPLLVISTSNTEVNDLSGLFTLLDGCIKASRDKMLIIACVKAGNTLNIYHLSAGDYSSIISDTISSITSDTVTEL